VAPENETPNSEAPPAAAPAGTPAPAAAPDASDPLAGDTLLGAAPAAKADEKAEDKPAGNTDADAKPKEGDKPADGDAAKPEDKAADAVPEGDYTVTLDPETFKGVEIDKDVLAEATPALKEAGVTQGQMNVLAPVAAQLVQKGADQMQSALVGEIVATRKAWHDATMADKEIGGTKANLDASVALAAKAIDQFGGQELRDELNRTGYGNNPLLIKFMKRVGESVSETTFHPTGGSQDKPVDKRDDTALFYGDTHKNGAPLA
jgi:hypothetical protein